MVRENLLRALPEIDSIKSVDLREKVIEVWKRGLEVNKWDQVESIPFTLEIPTSRVNLVKHTRAVTNHSVKMAEIMNEVYDYNVNMDFVIAGALLHDVCKIVEYSALGGKTPIGNYTTHGVYGVHLCVDVGMPVEVTHIVASHTKRMGMTHKTIEAIIVHYCDLGDAQGVMLTNQLPFLTYP